MNLSELLNPSVDNHLLVECTSGLPGSRPEKVRDSPPTMKKGGSNGCHAFTSIFESNSPLEYTTNTPRISLQNAISISSNESSKPLSESIQSSSEDESSSDSFHATLVIDANPLLVNFSSNGNEEAARYPQAYPFKFSSPNHSESALPTETESWDTSGSQMIMDESGTNNGDRSFETTSYNEERNVSSDSAEQGTQSPGESLQLNYDSRGSSEEYSPRYPSFSYPQHGVDSSQAQRDDRSEVPFLRNCISELQAELESVQKESIFVMHKNAKYRDHNAMLTELVETMKRREHELMEKVEQSGRAFQLIKSQYMRLANEKIEENERAKLFWPEPTEVRSKRMRYVTAQSGDAFVVNTPEDQISTSELLDNSYESASDDETGDGIIYFDLWRKEVGR